MKIPRTAILASLLALAGCSPSPIITGCELYPTRGLTYSAMNDTPETVRQIRETNAAFRAACGR